MEEFSGRPSLESSTDSVTVRNIIVEHEIEMLQPLEELTIAKLQRFYANGMKVVSVVQAHLNRYDSLDEETCAVTAMNNDVLQIAEALDLERSVAFDDDLPGIQSAGRPLGLNRGPLFGVPVFIKDNIYVRGSQLQPMAGSLALGQSCPKAENPAVSRLRDAGAVIMGTTNCSEWANFRAYPSDNGWSPKIGQTFGGYHFRQDPSGSSSGSAVAVDLGMCVAALGTETSGSIIFPGSQNNVVGFKPTVGLVSRRSVVPISPAQDTIGVFARSYEDASIVLNAIACESDGDFDEAIKAGPLTGTLSSHIRSFPAFRQIRIGVPRNALEGLDPQILASFEQLILGPLQLEAHVTIVNCSFKGIDVFKRLDQDSLTAYMAGEFHDALLTYLYCLKDNFHALTSWESLCAFMENEENELFGQEETAVDESGTPIPYGGPEVWEIDAQRHAPGSAGQEIYFAGKTNIQVDQLLHLKPKYNIKRLRQAATTTRESEAYVNGKIRAEYFAGSGGIGGALDGQHCAEYPSSVGDKESQEQTELMSKFWAALGRTEPDEQGQPGVQLGDSNEVNEVDGVSEVNEHMPVDFLLVPTDASCANYFAAGGGYPQVTLPLGYYGPETKVELNKTGRLVRKGPNIPFGVSLIGRRFDEMRDLGHYCKMIEALVSPRDEIRSRRPAFLAREGGGADVV